MVFRIYFSLIGSHTKHCSSGRVLFHILLIFFFFSLFVSKMQEEEEEERLAMINGMSLTGGGGGGGEASFSDEYIRAIKAEISSHPLYQKLLSVHINCLYVATPTDHRHTIDAQITTHSHLHHTVIHSRSTLSQQEKQELDTFMVIPSHSCFFH